MFLLLLLKIVGKQTRCPYVVTVSHVSPAECREADNTAASAGQGVLLQAGVRSPEPTAALR